MATAVIITAAGCGAPSGLDHQEQVAFARECTSLVERNLSDNSPPRAALLGRDKVDLDDPTSFYSTMERIRGPETFNLHDPAHAADTGRQPLDNCDTKPLALQSLFPPAPSSTTSTTATTTTTTTVPGS